LFGTFAPPTDIYIAALEARAETHVGLYQKQPIMLSEFQQNLNLPTNFNKPANGKFNDHQSITSRNVTCGQKDKHTQKKMAGAFLKLLLCQRSKEFVIWRSF
jgi:hypothetical protein